MNSASRFEELLKIYRGLSEPQAVAYRLLCALYGSVGAGTFKKLLRTQEFEALTPYMFPDVNSLLASWTTQGLAVQVQATVKTPAWHAESRLSEFIVRELRQQGQLSALYAVIGTWLEPEPPVRWQTFEFSAAWKAVYYARKALYTGNAGLLSKLLSYEVSIPKRPDWKAEFARNVLLNPYDESLISSLPEQMRQLLIPLVTRYANSPDLRKRFALMQKELCLSLDDDAQAPAAVRALCNLGLFEDAAQLKPLLSAYDRNWLAAVDALVRGQNGEAKTYFDRWLRHAREVDGRPSDAAEAWELFYVPLLSALGEAPDAIKKACVKGQNRTNWNDGGSAYSFLDTFAQSDENAAGEVMHRSFFTDALDYLLTVLSNATAAPVLPSGETVSESEYIAAELVALDCPARPDLMMHFLLACKWRFPKYAKKLLKCYAPLADVLTARGMTFFAGELRAAEAQLSGRSTEGQLHPLCDLIHFKEKWERSLDAIERLAENTAPGKGKKSGTRRLLWLVEWKKNSDSARVEPAVTALEQTMSAKGVWSKGRSVAASTIAKGFDRIPDLPDADRRVRDAVAVYGGYGFYDPTSYELDPCHALYLLAGNPSVVRADDFSPLEVVRGEPRLVVSERRGVTNLLLLPERLNGEEFVVEEDSPSRLRVTKFDAAQSSLASVLGDGISIPAQGRERMMKALSALAGTVAFHSDASELQGNIPEVECNRTLYARLSPSGDGLTAEFVVRPFGNEGLSCRPGGGSASLSGTVKNEQGVLVRVRTQRDLDAEARAFQAAVAACPTLDKGENNGGASWTLAEPDTCLELLQELKNVPGLELEWPRGGVRTVRAELGSSALVGAAQTSGEEWFTLSGTVKVDSELTLSLRQLFSLMRGQKSRFIPLGERQFLALTRELQRRVESLAALCEEKSGTLRVSPLAAYAVDGLFENGALATDQSWRDLCNRFARAAQMEFDVPRTLRAQLRAYQTEGYQWLSRLAYCGAGACLADEMGLGKTVQTLALLLSRAPDGPALIVAPTSVCGNWLDEAARFAPTLNMIDYRSSDRESVLNGLGAFDAVLVSYGLLQSDAERFAGVSWHTIVLDEAQAVKNMATKRSNAVMSLHGDFRMIMTGTPVENRLSELWNLFRFINPGFLGSLERFNRLFASPIADGDERARTRLRKVVAPFLLRRTKEEVLDDLPPRTDVTLRIDLSDQERSFYEALRQDAVEAVSAAGNATTQDARFALFAHLMKLRRCCCAVSLTEEGAALAAPIPSSKTAALLELSAQLRAEGHRALIFSQFTDHLGLIKKALEADGAECLYLDGSTPAHARNELVAQFQAGKGDFFLISLRAGGTGLNLTGADYVIHMDPWWNPAVEDQASDRAHRIGQKRPVTVYRLVARGTVEEKIVDLHREKRSLAADVLSGAGSPAALDLDALVKLLQEK